MISKKLAYYFVVATQSIIHELETLHYVVRKVLNIKAITKQRLLLISGYSISLKFSIAPKK